MQASPEQPRGRFNLTFLAEASQILSRSLDPNITIAEVARLYVPLICDCCTIDVVDGGLWRRVAAAHIDDRKRDLLLEIGRRYVSGNPPTHLLAQVAASGEPVLRAHVTDAELVAMAPDDEYLALARQIGAISAMVVPLTTGGRTFGIMALTCYESKRHFSQEDLALSAELARRAATAIDNARLFRDAERARREAEAARQRSQFLSRASDVLASAVSFQQVLDEAAALALPDLGDCCIIDFNERDSGRPFGLSHVDPAVGEALKAQVCADRSVLTPLSPPPALPHAGDYAAGALSPAASALMALLRPRALLSLPLLVRDGRWGMVTFVRSGPAAAYSSEETELGEELLRRVAGAIDRAWLIDELQKAVKVRDEFLSIASHELRTPLTALELQLGNLTRLMAKPDPLVWRERFSDKLERATRQTGRLAKLIDNLLDVSRISAGRFRLEPEPMDLARLCQDLGERWSDEAGVAGCRLELDIVGPCEGQWDPLRLEQVITNLLSNAVKYGAGQPIELSLRQDPSGVRMQVRDHGIGVAQGALARIFDRFERAVSPREFGGLGLGLFITREIVEAHGGQISVQSTLGEGATFIVRLPWASEATHHDGGMEGLLPFG